MYCKYCGKEINDNAGFCPHCGAKKESHVEPSQPKAQYSGNYYSRPPVANRTSTAKLLMGIFGTIGSVAGGFLFLIAILTMMTETGYTWSRPYTTHEVQVITMMIIGIFLLINGVGMLILLLVSKKYTDKNVQDPGNIYNNAMKCPVCGLQVAALVKSCPRCKTQIK